MTKLILIGGGGHCKVCIDIIEQTGQFEIYGILDKPSSVGKSVLNYRIVGTDNDIAKYVDLNYSFFITIGHIKSSAIREKIFNILKDAKANIATIIAPSAKISRYSSVGDGTIVMHEAMINAGAKVGENCILNNKCDVEHDALIGNHTHVSTNAVVNGDCVIGNGVFIGSNATIANQIIVKDNVVIGAGAVVIREILAKDIQAGNPAKSIKK